MMSLCFIRGLEANKILFNRGRLYVEVRTAKPDEDCHKRSGETSRLGQNQSEL
jgi:hypothetical protein